VIPPPVLEILAELVRINSVNPAYAGGAGEAAISRWIGEFLSAWGIESFEQEVLPGRPNRIARLPGREPGRRLIFEAHTDTASVDGMAIPPFEPAIREGRLYGRGACDTKAGLAAMLHAAVTLASCGEQPRAEVWIAATADEEHAYRGVLKLCEGLEAEGAVVSEPTSMRLVVATKGCLRFRLHTRGRAAHSSKPELGVNAIVRMAALIQALEHEAAGLRLRRHPLLGAPTLNIGLIRGGTQVNMVPESCWIEVDRRLIPGESVEGVLRHYEQLVASTEAGAWIETTLTDEPLETPAEARVARVAARVLDGMDLEAEPAGVPYGSDASKLARAGIPSIVVGPGSIDQAHAAVEWVDCAELERAAEFYRRMMLEF
jgi:acetylornithine deacetylase